MMNLVINLRVLINLGIIEENENLNDFEQAYAYFRTMYKKISTEDINEYSVKYRNSSEEKEDLITFYNKFNGNLTLLLEYIPCSNNEDIKRFQSLFKEWISNGELKESDEFLSTFSSIKLLPDESAEIEEEQMKDLTSLIRANNASRHNNFLANLEEKYGNKKEKKKRAKKTVPKISKKKAKFE